MWKTNDPLMQPQVDELNRMMEAVYDAGISLEVPLSDLVLLIGFNRYKTIENIMSHRPDVMMRTFHGATIVKIMDPDAFAIVVTSGKAGEIARKAVSKELYKIIPLGEE